MELIDEAEATLAGLRDVPPQRATKATVDAYRGAIELDSRARPPPRQPWAVLRPSELA